MRAEELRIGNLVTIDNETSWSSLKDVVMTVQRVEIGKDKMFPLSTGSVRCYDGKKEYNQFDEFIKPIPLTEDWLKRFGFNLVEESLHEFPRTKNIYDKTKNVRRLDKLYKLGDTLEPDYRDMSILVIRDPDSLSIRSIGLYYVRDHYNEAADIKYVHQLQNLYFALTGEELKLN